MMETMVLLDSIGKVKKFVSIAEKFDEKMDLICGRNTFNAKSIICVFNMDLARPFTLRIYGNGRNTENIMEALREYIVD